MIILVFLVAFKFLFLIFPSVVLVAAREGLLLWFNNVLPALLPFLIITNMLVGLGIAQRAGGKFAPVMRSIFGLPGAGGVALVFGLTSGYPIGAKTVADLRKKGEISATEAQHLVAFCNNAGPAFILAAVGIGMFGNTQVGYVLWGGHVIAALAVGVLLKIFYGRTTAGEVATPPHKNTKNYSIGEAVKNAMESMAIIGGMIIFFSVIMAVLGEIGLPEGGLLAGFIAGLVEVTGGVRKISQETPSVLGIGLAAFAIGFGGLSIHMQTLHFTEGTGIKPVVYLAHKALHGAIAAIVTVLIWMLVFTVCPIPVFGVHCIKN